MYTDTVALIIPNGVLQNGSDCFELIDPDSGGQATFSVPLRLKGETGGATYWGASTQLLQTAYDALTTMTTAEFKNYLNTLKPGKTVAGAAFKNSLLIGAPGQRFWSFVAANNMERVP